MKNCFSVKLSDAQIAIADLCDYYGEGMIITRINVPVNHRGKGIGSELLTRILAEADSTQTTLFLEIQPSGGLDYTQLEQWYRRHGFKNMRGSGVFRRRPRPRSGP